MSDLFLERTFESPITETELYALSHAAFACLELHRVNWVETLLAVDGRRTLCRFRAPDAESARLALHQAGPEAGRLWAGTIHDTPLGSAANVLVERRFTEPVALEEIQAREEAAAWCLETHRVQFVRTFLALDQRRMICLYRAPDAEAVRLAQRQARMPVERVWAFRAVTPERIAGAGER